MFPNEPRFALRHFREREISLAARETRAVGKREIVLGETREGLIKRFRSNVTAILETTSVHIHIPLDAKKKRHVI